MLHSVATIDLKLLCISGLQNTCLLTMRFSLTIHLYSSELSASWKMERKKGRERKTEKKNENEEGDNMCIQRGC